mgnify:CR=1 FL=1
MVHIPLRVRGLVSQLELDVSNLKADASLLKAFKATITQTIKQDAANDALAATSAGANARSIATRRRPFRGSG